MTNFVKEKYPVNSPAVHIFLSYHKREKMGTRIKLRQPSKVTGCKKSSIYLQSPKMLYGKLFTDPYKGF